MSYIPMIALINYNGIELVAEYDVEPYQAASMDGPEILPELEISKILNAQGEDVYADYSEEDILSIESLIIKQLED